MSNIRLYDWVTIVVLEEWQVIMYPCCVRGEEAGNKISFQTTICFKSTKVQPGRITEVLINQEVPGKREIIVSVLDWQPSPPNSPKAQ